MELLGLHFPPNKCLLLFLHNRTIRTAASAPLLTKQLPRSIRLAAVGNYSSYTDTTMMAADEFITHGRPIVFTPTNTLHVGPLPVTSSTVSEAWIPPAVLDYEQVRFSGVYSDLNGLR